MIAGWDQEEYELKLKQLCRELGISFRDVPAVQLVDDRATASLDAGPSVIFTGPLFGELKERLLWLASAFILPSFSEGLPMSLLEAWAHELPVLMTEHCNLPEGFSASAAIQIGTGADSIAEGMMRLFGSSDAELGGMGENGLNLVTNKFTWSEIAAQMKQLYQWILEGSQIVDKPSFVR